MSQEQPPIQSAILRHADRADLGNLVVRAVVWTLPRAAILGLVCAVLAGLHSWLSPTADVLTFPDDLLPFLRGLGLVTLLFAVLLFLGRLLWISPAMNAAFKILGFLATFFGLGMLTIFALSLFWNVRDWFATTGQLVRLENYKLAQQQKELENLTVMRADKLAELREDMANDLAGAADEAEKEKLRQDYEKKYIPKSIGFYDQRLAQLKITTEKGLRPDSSGFAILSHFLFEGASDKPQDSGVWYALLGSVWVALITIVFAVPVGVAAALYLEEYRSKGWVGNLIQININNLAGVPSVVYGILGGFVFVELIFKEIVHGYLGLREIAPRNVLGGGLTLGLLTLPVIIVSAQEAIRAVPRSIRDGAYALGATQWQTIWRNVLPMASPGILTGTILSLSRAIGEAAPMVLFGALLYVDSPPNLLSRFTVVPMQIFNWVDQPPAQTEPLAVTREQLVEILDTGELRPRRFKVQAKTEAKADQYVAWIKQLGREHHLLQNTDPSLLEVVRAAGHEKEPAQGPPDPRGPPGVKEKGTAGKEKGIVVLVEGTVIPEGIGVVYITEAWHNNAALGIVVLLLALLSLNAVAIWLRNRAQRQMRY